MKKRILSIFLVVVMLVTMLSAYTIPSFAATYSGACGDNLTWTFDDSTGKLTISGTGAMYDYIGSCPWENYKSDIKTIVVSNGVTTLSGYGFYYCYNLTTITIPASVTTIDSYAFYSCSSLNSITVNSNNKYYSSDEYGVLFNKDKSTLIKYPAGNTRTSYTIPDGVTIIGDHAFESCSSLKSVTIPDSVTTIGASAFYNCTRLTTLTIGNSVTTIGVEAFAYCTSLSNITLPNGVATISDRAFYRCDSLRSITIPASVTTISSNVFNFSGISFISVDGNNKYYSNDEYGVLFNKDKTTLVRYPMGNSRKSYIIPNSVTTIGNSAFFYCDNLTSVTIPDSVTTIDNSAFSDCSNLTSITIPNSITTIGSYAFNACDGLTSITIPDSVTTIGICAFQGCSNLTDVIIGNSVTTIDNSIFNSCRKLTSVTIPDSVTTIGASAFYYCTSLTSITLPNSVTTIGDSAFSDCTSLKSITILDSVTTIGNSVFEDCTSLTDVTIGNGVTTIGDYVFSGCTSFTDVTIGNSVTTISHNAFEGCTRFASIMVGSDNKYYSNDENGILFNKDKTTLVQYPMGNTRTSYTIPDGVTIIGDHAFKSCSSLKSVTIPDSVTTIGASAFYNCTRLASVTIPDSVTTIGEFAFDACRGLTDVIIGNSVTTISNRTFSSCTSLKSITIPSSVTTIGDSAFMSCTSLTSVTIPDSVTTIGNRTFYVCTRLTDVNYYGTEDDWNAISISSYNEPLLNATIHYNYVPPFTGVKDNRFYKDDVMQKAYQLVEFDGAFYYIADRHEIVKNKSVYINAQRVEGFTYPDGTPLKAGYYDFDENGKMIMLDGIVGNKVYKNNVQLKAYQLVEVDGDYYYIADRHEIVRNNRVYIKAERLNGLTYPDGTPLTAGYYDFDENGKMIMLDGIVGNKVYKNNVQLKAYQFVEVDGDLYYIADRHEIVKNNTIYIKAERLVGFTYPDGTPLTAGYYSFDEDGKLIILDGIVGNKVYKNNVQLKAYQLVEIDGDFYYIGDKHEIAKDKSVYIKAERTNGLTFADGTPITAGWYEFDENGKMIIV